MTTQLGFSRMVCLKSADSNLSPHEIRLLQLFADGCTYQDAADRFLVTTHAISFHLRNIYEKLEVHSKAEAVSKALRTGLIA